MQLFFPLSISLCDNCVDFSVTTSLPIYYFLYWFMRKLFAALLCISSVLCLSLSSYAADKENRKMTDFDKNKYKEIYLAGGCFWGVEKYFASIKGVVFTNAGYANGRTDSPSYEDVLYGNTMHAETVRVIYDPDIISLPFILDMYYKIIDPVSVNKQGNDRGTQYRTGIYYTDANDRHIIEKSLKTLSESYDKPLAVECSSLINYYPAEEYHQKYLDKNPFGYCHIPKSKFEEAAKAEDVKLKNRAF